MTRRTTGRGSRFRGATGPSARREAKSTGPAMAGSMLRGQTGLTACGKSRRYAWTIPPCMRAAAAGARHAAGLSHRSMRVAARAGAGRGEGSVALLASAAAHRLPSRGVAARKWARLLPSWLVWKTGRPASMPIRRPPSPGWHTPRPTPRAFMKHGNSKAPRLPPQDCAGRRTGRQLSLRDHPDREVDVHTALHRLWRDPERHAETRRSGNRSSVLLPDP